MNTERKKNTLLQRIYPAPEGFDLNYLTLKFRNKELEKEFLESHFQDSKIPSRYVILFALFFYASFIFLDVYLLPELIKSFIIIRFAIIIPFALIVIAISFTQIYSRVFQSILSLLIFLGGAGIVAIIYVSRENTGNPLLSFYFVGLILVFIFGYNFLKVRFKWASLACWLITALYFYVAIFKIDIPEIHLTAGLFFVICANIMSGFAGYHFEFIIRKNYFLNQQISEEKHKVLEMNSTLEEKVRERTFDLEIAKNKAEESDQLKSMFLANISHEIRTPMNGILGFSSLLSTTKIEDDKKDHFISIINERGQYLMGILDNLLDISMIESKNLMYNPTEIEVNSLMKNMKPFLDSFFIDKQVKLSLDLEEEDSEIYIKTDKVKLEQIITNLVSNAAKYAEKGSCILGYQKQITHLTFFVKDSGPGIPDYYRPHIFKSFVKGDPNLTNRKSGTGLGLAISKGLADFLGAQLSFESEMGKGTEFFLKFNLFNHHRAENTVK